MHGSVLSAMGVCSVHGSVFLAVCLVPGSLRPAK